MALSPGRGQRLLAWPGLPLVAAMLAVLLSAPAIRVGWYLDDYAHRVWLAGPDAFPGWDARLFPSSPTFGLFSFISADPDRTRLLMDRGFAPWWTLPELQLSFCRPLAALTHVLDFALWPDSAAFAHVHSLIWLGLAVAMAGLMYRRILGAGWIAGLAALFFALDDAHATPVAWIANRNALIALFFGLCAALAFARARSSGRWPWQVVSTISLAAALLSAEAGAATFAYLLAYTLFLDRGAWPARLTALLPHLGVLLAWRLAYTLTGHGAWGSGFYIDAGVEPGRFLHALLSYGPVDLLAQWALPPAELYIAGLLRGWSDRLTGAGLAFAVLLAIMLAPLLRRDAAARFWAAGMLLSLVLACTALPMDRMLLFVGIGAHGLTAQFLGGIVSQASWRPDRRVWRVTACVFAVALLIVHVAVAAAIMPLRSGRFMGRLSTVQQRIATSAPIDAAAAARTVVIVNTPSVLNCTYLSLVRHFAGLPEPRELRLLGPSEATMTVTRTDAHTLVIAPRHGYLAHPLDRLCRALEYPLPAGAEVRLDGFTATVQRLTSDGRPAEVAFRFKVPLEAPSFYWLCWQGLPATGGYTPWQPPEIGATVTLAPLVNSWPAVLIDDPVAPPATAAQP